MEQLAGNDAQGGPRTAAGLGVKDLLVQLREWELVEVGTEDVLRGSSTGTDGPRTRIRALRASGLDGSRSGRSQN